MSSDLDNALAVLRGRIDEQFRITERLDAKSRQAFALAAAFYAGAQAVAFSSFAADSVTASERWLVLVSALSATAALARVARRLSNGEALQQEDDFSPQALVEWFDEATEPDYVSQKLVVVMAHVADRRTEGNAVRKVSCEAVASSARLAWLLALAEAVVAVSVRI